MEEIEQKIEEVVEELRYLVQQYCRARGRTTKDPSEEDYKYFDRFLEKALSEAIQFGRDEARRNDCLGVIKKI